MNYLSNIVPLLLVAICFLAGIIFIYQTIQGFLKGRKSSNWPSIKGIIKHSKCEEYSGENGIIYELSVSYNYNVYGINYEGNRYRYSPSYSIFKKKKIDKLVNQFTINPEVIVYYNPKDPSDSVLDINTFPISLLFGCLYGLSSIGIGFYIIWKLYKVPK
jgi:hypothetical protein